MRAQLAPLFLLALPLLAGCPSNEGGGGGADTITVTGQVRGSAGGTLAGIKVLVSGQVATSDSAGNFTVEDVETPYDLFAYEPESQYVIGVVGATRTDPVVELYNTTDREGALDVTLSPASVGGESAVTFAGVYSYSGATNPDTFLVSAQWAGASSRAATIFVTRVINTSGLISYVYDHGSEDVTLQDNQTIAVPITMSPIATSSLDVTTSTQPGYQFLRSSAVTSLASDNFGFVLFNGQSTSNPTPFVAFDSALYRTRIQGVAVPSGGTTSDGYGIAVSTVGPGTTALTLEPPARLELTSPAAGSTFSVGSVLSWTTPLAATAGYDVAGAPSISAGPYLQISVGQATSFTMPDLSPLGVTFPAEEYFVYAAGYAPGPTPDEKLSGIVSLPDATLGSSSETRGVQMTP